MTRRAPTPAGIATVVLCAVSAAAPGAAARQPATAITLEGEYFGMCDASAAIAIDRDHFVVANDEDNFLRLYRVGSKQPVARFPLNFVEATRESDIEGVAAVGRHLIWIASHGRNKEGKARPDRQRLFAADIVQNNDGSYKLVEYGAPYRDLLTRLIASPALANYNLSDSAALAPEAEKGLNIEGLATFGRSVLIGFRNPRPGGKALVIELKNPTELVEGRADDVEIGAVSELDLNGRGIRSLEWIPARKAFLLIAGPHDGSGSFALYRWTGPGSAPVELPISFNRLVPEALFVQNDSFAVLSDDGDRMIGRTECKSMKREEDRRFRTGRFTLPDS